MSQVCGSVEVQVQVSWLSEMTGAQEKDRPPPRAVVHFPALPAPS